MRYRSVALSAIVAFALPCCVAKRDVVLNSSFSPAEAKYVLLKGNARIEGQAFMRQVGGTVVTAAGSPVVLMPATTYTDEMIAKTSNLRGAYAPQINMNIDPSMQDYVKKTQADGSGNFSFENVAAGDYYVITRVTWGVPTRYTIEQQGGDLVERVTVGKGGTTKIIMTR